MFDGQVLKNLRIKKQITPSELTFELDKIGLRISRPTILNWEQGLTEPKVSQAYSIAKYFKCSLESFFKNQQ